MKFVVKVSCLLLCALFCQLWATEYNDLENSTRGTGAIQVDVLRNEWEDNSVCTWVTNTSVVARDRLSNCGTAFVSYLPSCAWLRREAMIAGGGYGATLGFFLGGYFMIQHALDLTDHNYWHEVNHCKKTVNGYSKCEQAYYSMIFGSIFEFFAFAGFCITTSYLISPECGLAASDCFFSMFRNGRGRY